MIIEGIHEIPYLLNDKVSIESIGVWCWVIDLNSHLSWS